MITSDIVMIVVVVLVVIVLACGTVGNEFYKICLDENNIDYTDEVIHGLTIDKITEVVTDVITKQQGLLPQHVTPDRTIANLYLDSLDCVEIVMDVENALHIELDEYELEQLKSIQNFIDLIDSVYRK